MFKGTIKFLLVDDVEANLFALEQLLARERLELVKARSGAEALEMLLRHDIALALLDVQMPEMDGFELAELMRGTERTRRVPIIFITAGATSEQRQFRGYELGAVDFLFKPIDPQILKSKADVFFELACQRQELQAAAEENARLLEERIAAERALQQSQHFLSEIVQTSPALIVVSDEHGRIVVFNRACEKLTGYAEKEVLGQTISDLFLPPEWRPIVARKLESATSNAAHEPQANPWLTKSGEERWIEWRCIALAAEAEAPKRILGAGIDVTERRGTEAALQSAKKAAEEGTRAKDQFLAALSHELRNPLNPVLLTASEVLADESTTPEAREAWEIVHKNVTLERALIDDLLDLTRIARGKMTIERVACEAHRVLRDAIATVRGSFDEKQHQVALHLEAVSTNIHGDAVRLQQVFWNVLSNAAKFTGVGGTITITTSNPNATALRIEIADTGIGLTAEEQGCLFKPFAQGDHALAGGSHRFGGLGLGMAITRQLVELHGGEISAESSGRGCGATFKIELPTTASTVEVPASNRTAPKESPSNGPSISSQRVLVIEDHESSRVTLSRLLARRGYMVASAATAGEARRQVREQRFDIVFSDIGLPDGDGYSLIEELRATLGPELRSIAMSGYGMPDDLAKSRAAGFNEHLTKPVEIGALDSALQRLASQIRPSILARNA